MKNNSQGFTLVELLVGMSLFVIVISISSGVFIHSLRTQRLSVALIAANGNASLTIEQMAREMRTGQNFVVSGGGSQINFINAAGASVKYHLENNTTIERNDQPITASNVAISSLRFTLLSDPYPNRITINMSVEPADSPISGIITNLQTTISSRIIPE